MHPSLHLTGSVNGEPKDQGNHRSRSRANEGERDQCRFSHIVGHLPKRFRLVCRTLGKKFLMTFRRSRHFWPDLGKKFLMTFRRSRHFWPANAALLIAIIVRAY